MPPAPDLAAHRLLGDGRSSALLGDDGEVRWWCAPRLDSPPLLWSLLDGDGAAARWIGATSTGASGRGPVAGAALRTTVVVEGVAVELLDGVVARPGRCSTLLRFARVAGGHVPTTLVHELALGGFDQPWGRWDPGTATLAVGARRLRVRGGSTDAHDGGRRVRTRLAATPGRWAALVVSEGEEPDDDELRRELEAAQAAAEEAAAVPLPPRHHPERVADAMAVLVACTDSETGRVVAAPTTSLPEALGGDRQFDYRFQWLRDASLAVSVASLFGRADLARRHLVDLAREPDAIPPLLRTVTGDAVPEEREVPGVAGYAGSRPVRVGNAASEQLQYDALAFAAEAVSLHVQTGGHLPAGALDLLGTVADELAAEPSPRPSNGIWEHREARLFTSADIGVWMALERAIRLHRLRRPWLARRRWVAARERARRRLLGALSASGALPQVHGEDGRPDAAALALVLFSVLPRRDPRRARVVERVLHDLGEGAHVRRYPPGDDGFSGLEGAFVPMSWWAVSCLALLGRVDEARARADALCASLPRLMPEEADPVTGRPLGNTPLVWSHMEAARALYLLDTAAIRARWGGAGLLLWRLARYVRLVRVARRARHTARRG